MYHFHIYTKGAKDSFLNYRKGEKHLGEQIQCCDDFEEADIWLQQPNIKFVLLGLAEDVGVRANQGIGGTQTSWLPFLKSLLNIQETEQLPGQSILLYGCLQSNSPSLNNNNTDLDYLRQETENIDQTVFPIIQKIIAAGKIPLIIGGGHNNAYPILKGASLAFNQSVNAINTDAHADFRALEGRHSGNGFSYAYNDNYLKKYFALGLHESYNSREMMQIMSASPDIDFIFWEDIFLRQKTNWQDAIKKGLEHVSSHYFGTELDTDCIENTLSSAATPVGISTGEALQTLYTCGKNQNAIYLHLPEAIAHRADGLQNPLAGKLLSYLVQSFVKGVLER